MKITKSRLAKLLRTFFALLPLFVPAFCQSGSSANFSLTVTNNLSQAFISVVGTSNGSTYAILTNSSLATNGWSVWKTLSGSNAITPAPPISLSSTALFFKGELLAAPVPNYAAYSNFWLSISNSAKNLYITLQGTLPSLTYLVLTNSSLSSTNWGIWTNLLATNNVTPAPPFVIGSNALFFEGALVISTGTNGLGDYWCMEYFGTLNVDPYADPDGDGLCNLDEYLLGSNPTNAYSITPLHTDAQALFLAYTNFDANCRYQLFVTNGPDTNTVLVTMSPTLVGTNYQIYTCEQGDPTMTWRVEANFLGTSSATTVAITLNGRSLDYIGGYGEDSDGDGLPDGYEVLATLTDPYLPDTGMTGIPDGYKDPDGDGYSNLQEYYNGTNPHHFDTPAGPQGLVADFTDGGNSLTFSWQPTSGPVLDYVIYAYSDTTGQLTQIATVAPTQLTYILNNITAYSPNTSIYGGFAVQAIYASGTSLVNQGMPDYQPAVATLALANGPGGKIYLLSSAATSNVLGYTNFYFPQYAWFYPEGTVYDQTDGSYYPPSPFETDVNAYIPASQFTNGVAILTDAQAPPYMQTALYNAVIINGGYGYAQLPGGVRGGALWCYPDADPAVPFIDGSAQMKENIRFLLRVASAYPFAYSVPNNSMTYPTNYVYSTYYHVDPRGLSGNPPDMDHFAPFEDNYFYRNLVFDAQFIDTNGNLETGFSSSGNGGLGYEEYTNPPQFEFPTYDYVTLSNQVPIPGILASATTPWVGCFSGGYVGENILPFGAYHSGNSLAMSNCVNLYGLPYTELLLTLTNGDQAILSPEDDVSGWNGGDFYAGTAQPELQTLGYYFAIPLTKIWFGGPDYMSESVDPLPGFQDGSFTVTNTTPLIIGSVGTPMLIAGYAKQAVLNGNPNVFAFLGQYFTNAFVMSNGVVTTNPAGILSEYGEFFPTVPGQAALLTMPDPDQNNIQGTCVVDIIRLSLDANHDGIMDETYTGPDNTSSGAPFLFWANNDYDRYHSGTEDDLETASQPDCNYTVNGNRCIPCPRDLEDYARLWVSGVSSNVLANLPAGSTVTLNWGDVGSPNPANPAIDIFQAADADGGMGYLTNGATATNQINTNLCQYVGRLGPGGSIQLNASTFSNSWAGNHYIWCGVLGGSGQLNLTIADGSGNVLAQSSQYIQIQDIKQMYERWTVGDAPFATPMSNAVPAEDNFSPGYPTTPFQYSYDPAYDTNDAYIVYVHGWNMKTWEKDRWAETMYKRLYWQGYQGRFGSFRWPTGNGFSSIISVLTDANNYNNSEWTAWKSGQPLENFLAGLNSHYPGKVYVLAHSMGNVVTGEALRLAGTNVIVNTYVASQAAISARAYDNTVPADATNSYTPHVYGPDDEGHYYTNGAPPYFNGIAGASHFADYYNQVDYALGYWVIDQNFKADSLNYHYTTPTSQFPSGFYYEPPFNLPRALTFPTNTYETFAQAVQSYSFALGAETNVASTFSIRTPVNLNATPYNFGPLHVGHSLQFRSDNMTVEPYWNQLLISFGLQP